METLHVSLRSIDDKVKFSASARENPAVTIDYYEPIGTGQGYTSLELLMASFGSCVSTALVTLLRNRLRKQVDAIHAEVHGTVRQEHPKALSHITLALTIEAPDLTEAETRKMLQVAEENICPVWAMIKGNVEVEVRVAIQA